MWLRSLYRTAQASNQIDRSPDASTTPRRATQLTIAGVCALFGILLGVGGGWACETPVYRYAMYRWQPTPYEVYSFHDAANAEAHSAVEKAIADVAEATDNRANIVFIPVNLTTDPELEGVTPDIKQAWTSQENPELPSYLISTPYGVQIYAGKLDATAIKSLVESPARKKMAQQLEAGKIGVLLYLSGKDEQQNEKTKNILAGLVKEVGEGKVSLYSAPAKDASAAAEDAAPVGNPALELGLIEVNRDDAKESWLVRSLLAMESDLPEESRPMVFLTYGRGRALLPYIGEGITRENLIREVEFISGACSCTVKEQNPGVDLLVRYDWDAASAALADRFGTEEGNESEFGPGDFLPQLIIPSSTAPTSDAVAANNGAADPTESGPTENAAGDDSPVDKPADTVVAGGTSAETASNSEDPKDHEATMLVRRQQRPSQDDEIAAGNDDSNSGDGAEPSLDSTVAKLTDADKGDVASLTTSDSPDPAGPAKEFKSRTYVSMFIVGGGLALGLVVLFGLTFFVMRPH